MVQRYGPPHHRVYLSLLKIPPLIYSMTGYGKASARIGSRRYG